MVSDEMVSDEMVLEGGCVDRAFFPHLTLLSPDTPQP